MSDPIRVLHIFGGLNRGGSETMVMNIYRNIDRKRIQFDFVRTEDNQRHAYETEIEELGGRIFKIPQLSVNNLINYKNAFNKLIGNHPEWKVVHCNYLTTSFIYLDILKNNNRFVIAHSHTSGSVTILKKNLLKLLHKPIKKNADLRLACSNEAAKWIFEEKYNEVLIVKNAIDIDKFKYSVEIRNKMRNDFNFSDKFVIGHIGRFNKVKNHHFIIDVFKAILEKRSNAQLVLIGSGEEQENIVQYINELGLSDSILILNEQANPYDYYQMFDVFLFPSLYEGLGMVAVEAQTSGLLTIVSDRIPSEAYVTDLIAPIPLETDEDTWANCILKLGDNTVRKDTSEEVRNAGYDIVKNTRQLENIYLNID